MRLLFVIFILNLSILLFDPVVNPAGIRLRYQHLVGLIFSCEEASVKVQLELNQYFYS